MCWPARLRVCQKLVTQTKLAKLYFKENMLLCLTLEWFYIYVYISNLKLCKVKTFVSGFVKNFKILKLSVQLAYIKFSENITRTSLLFMVFF